jgi:hypothetical protein
MRRVYQHDKRSGLTYAYDAEKIWDEGKQKMREKRTLIGRVDALSGKIVSTDGRNKKAKVPKAPDYKKLYEGLQRKTMAQERLIMSLQTELSELKGALE